MEKLNKNLKQYLWLLMTLLSFTATYAVDEEDDWDGWEDGASWDDITTSLEAFVQDTDISFNVFENFEDYIDSGIGDFADFSDSEYGEYLEYMNDGFGPSNHVCGGFCMSGHEFNGQGHDHVVYDPTDSAQDWLYEVRDKEISSELFGLYDRDNDDVYGGLGSIGPRNEDDLYQRIEKINILDENNALDILIANNLTLLGNIQKNKENTDVADGINTAFVNGAGDGMGQVSGAAPEIFKDPDDFLGITVPDIDQMVEITKESNGKEEDLEDDCSGSVCLDVEDDTPFKIEFRFKTLLDSETNTDIAGVAGIGDGLVELVEVTIQTSIKVFDASQNQVILAELEVEERHVIEQQQLADFNAKMAKIGDFVNYLNSPQFQLIDGPEMMTSTLNGIVDYFENPPTVESEYKAGLLLFEIIGSFVGTTEAKLALKTEATFAKLIDDIPINKFNNIKLKNNEGLLELSDDVTDNVIAQGDDAVRAYLTKIDNVPTTGITAVDNFVLQFKHVDELTQIDLPNGYTLINQADGSKYIRRVDISNANTPRLGIDAEGHPVPYTAPARLASNATLRTRLGNALGDAIPSGHQAHHIVPDNVAKNSPLHLEAIERGIFDVDRVSNGKLLAESADDFTDISRNLPTHLGSHPNYDDAVQNVIRDTLIDEGVDLNNLSGLSNQQINNLIDDIEEITLEILENWTPSRLN